MTVRTLGTRRTTKRRRRLLARHGPWCWWCRAPFTDELPPTLDHLTPHGRGGSDRDENIVLACEPCNHERSCRQRCAGCGGQIKVWAGVVWVAKRWAYHGHCMNRETNALVA